MVRSVVLILAALAVCVVSAMATESVSLMTGEDDFSDVLTERYMARKCRGKKKYRVEITFNWSGMSHPDAYPEDGQFSPLVAASHSSCYDIWTPACYASKGVQVVAETGNIKLLLLELKYHLHRNVYDFKFLTKPTEDGTQTVALDIMVDGYGGRTLISAITMIFPSPDWFTGIDNMDTCDQKTGRWRRKIEGNLSAWDAGTDLGEDFESPNKPNRKYTPIVSILGTRFSGIPLGSYKIYQIKSY